MKNTLKLAAATCMAMYLTHSTLAQPVGQTNYQWSAAGDAVTWSQPANWTYSWTDANSVGYTGSGAVPPTDGTTYQIDISAAAMSKIPINIAATDVVSINDAMFGPMWGQTLNIHGNVTCGFGMFAWGDSSAVTTLNIFTNASLSLQNTMALGTAWWFPGGPNVIMNVYSNAQVGITWMQFGAKLNLYGGVVSVTNGFNTGTATTPVFSGGLDTDATRDINLAGGTLVLPAAYTATVNDWISRGILTVFGVPGDAAEIVISETNTTWPDRTVVYTTATNGNPILAVHLQLPRTSLHVGGLEQAQVYADYATSTNVNVTTTSGIGLMYQSTATNVATVSATGSVRATGAGTATIWVSTGTLSNSVLVTVSVYTNTATLIHRYSFSDDPSTATTVADSVPGNSPTWDGTLNGGATLTGSQLVLDGSSGFVQFPPGIVTNMDAVSVETWISFSSIPVWAPIFEFGDSDGVDGHNYISAQPHTANTTAQAGIRNGTTEQNPVFTPVLDNYTNVHFVAVFHPEAGYCSIYTNGVLAAKNSSIMITMADAMSTGDPYNYIGHSLWSNDPYLPAYIDEFRIYSGPLSLGQIQADAALGPNQLIGGSTHVALNASHSGNSLQMAWPTNSALVTLMASPVLGQGAVWTPVPTSYAIVGTNFQATIPVGTGTQFFRLTQ